MKIGTSQALLVALLFSGAALAQGAAGEEAGLSVAFEGWAATARGGEFAFAEIVDPDPSVAGGGRVVRAGRELQTTWRLGAGWRFGGPAAVAVEAMLWEHEVTSRSAAGPDPGQIGARLAAPALAIGRSFVDRADAVERLRATSADLLVTWNVAGGERGTLRAGAGLRAFRLETDATVVYEVAGVAGPETERVTAASDADGLGPALALEGKLDAGRVRLSARTLLALPIATVDTSLLDATLGTAFDRFATIDRPGERQVSAQLDLDLALEVPVGGGLTLTAGYRASYWSAAVRRERFLDARNPNLTAGESSDAVFAGATLGLRYEF